MLDKILKFEEKNDILNFKFSSGDLLWPFIRYTILYGYMKNYYGLQLESMSNVHKKMNIKELLKYIYITFSNNPYKVKKNYEILFFGVNSANHLRNDGLYFNRLHDYYTNIFPEKTFFIEKSHNLQYFRPRYFKNIAYSDYLTMNIILKSKILKKADNHDKKLANEFILFLKSNFQEFNYEFYNNIYNLIIAHSVQIPLYKKYYRKLFKKLKPKIIFVNTASYGNMYGHIVKIAKEMKIKTAEFQHGVITSGHVAYNYNDTILKNEEYKKYLPEYLLTYGDFWNDNMKTPVKKITIGNPHFWYNFERLNNEKKERSKKIILIVSQGTVTNINVKIAKELSKKIDKNYRIIFRLHPGEIPFEERYKELYNYNNIEINKEGDIYNLIHDSDYIISIYSTTIFEAVSLNKTVFIYKHPLSELHIPKNIGIWFNTVDELYEMIKNNMKSEKEYNIEYFWNKNWKENYINFLKNEIGIEVKK
ncbi:hypothetical protein [Marinitoga aeolica]|uniref:Capsule polysaccharide biosynthesis protein n=1 Tax=Marinitoga aeolica TaxID=2809031 RepID=A0ABY8PTQ9_9BACT|nr:hypothetical protein [Marinitoga aeolica]WGS66029.1 hypothetical protein JRV97_05630 [Marinitoga aeolica]